MNIEETIIAVQRKLGVQADGKAGPQTWAAIYGSLFPGKPVPKPLAPTHTKPLAPERHGGCTQRSEYRHPSGTSAAVRTGVGGEGGGGGHHNQGDQRHTHLSGAECAVRKGQVNAPIGKKYIVTNAPAGYSNHNFGIAFDIGVFEGAKYIPESPKYKAVGAIGMDIGLDWGGNWKSIQDEPHFQLRPAWAGDLSERDMLAELRSRTESGKGDFCVSYTPLKKCFALDAQAGKR